MKKLPLRAATWLAPALFAFVLAAPAPSPAASELLLGGAEVPLATAHLALLAPPLAEADARALEQQEIPEQEPEPRPEPFPAPPEQPPAERIPEEPEELPADQPPAEEEPEIEVEVPEVETELPEIEDDELEVEAESDTVWYADPFWIIVALVFVVVILILIFSGRRRRA